MRLVSFTFHLHSEWTQMGCDVAIQRSNRGKIRPVVRAKDEDLHSDLSGRPWCEHTKSKFGVVPLMVHPEMRF